MKLKLIVVGFLMGLSQQALSCSCAEWESPKEMLKNVEFAVLAVPTEKSVFRQVSYNNGGGDISQITMARTGMRVVRNFKGKYKKFFYLESEKSDGLGANCGVDFKRYDGLYLIFGWRAPNGYYTTTSCDMGMVLPEFDDESEQDSDWVDPIKKFLDEIK